MNVTENKKPPFSKLAIISVLIIVAAMISIIILTLDVIPPGAMCGINISRLGKAFLLYASENKERYPSYDKWCDLLIKYSDVPKKEFLCPSAIQNGDKGRCHFAVNPNCEPNSPADMVLLFETKAGWNQFGGPELLTLDNHNGKGANILFNDGFVRYIKKEDVGKLKWKAEDVNSVK